jgi:hypothetical protein
MFSFALALKLEANTNVIIVDKKILIIFISSPLLIVC